MIINVGAWDIDGEKTIAVNRAIMQMIALDLKPLCIVENSGFKKLLTILQPRFKIPSRYYFTNHMLPELYDEIKVKLLI